MRLPFIRSVPDEPPNVAAAVGLELVAAREQRDRLERIRNAWNIYRSGGTPPLVSKPGQPDDNTLINLCRIIVEKGADFLFGKPVEFDVVGDYEEQELWLDQVWRKNSRELLLHDIAINGAVTGDVFIRIVPDPINGFPRIVNIDPGTVVALWDPDDIENVIEYQIEWVGVDPVNGDSVARRQTITREGGLWVIRDFESRNMEPRWRQIASETWPYAWCPIVHAKNLPMPNEFYGQPDLTEDIIHMNDRINFVASNTSKIIRHHAHPKTWGRGFSNQELDISPDTVTIIHSPDGMLANLEMQSDLQSSLAWYRYLVSALHWLARVPEVATGRTESLGQLSGVALEILYGPIVDKTRTKRLLYGALLNTVNEHLLEMNGWRDLECRCRWADPWPVDNLTQAQIGIMYRNLGVSMRTIHDMLGLDYDRERRNALADGDQTVSGEPMPTQDTPGTRLADLRVQRIPRAQFTSTQEPGVE